MYSSGCVRMLRENVLRECQPREVIIILKYQFSIGHRAIFDVSGEKKKQNAFALIITKTIIILRLSEY